MIILRPKNVIFERFWHCVDWLKTEKEKIKVSVKQHPPQGDIIKFVFRRTTQVQHWKSICSTVVTASQMAIQSYSAVTASRSTRWIEFVKRFRLAIDVLESTLDRKNVSTRKDTNSR